MDGIDIVASPWAGDAVGKQGHLLDALISTPNASIATLVGPLRDISQLENPRYVKVITDMQRRALYLSRGRIPWFEAGITDLTDSEHRCCYMWLGVTAYRHEVLAHISALPETPLEKCEGIELLRALEHGYTIAVAFVDDRAASVSCESVERLIDKRA